MKLGRIHPDADVEMAQAAHWYDDQTAGVGKRFMRAVAESFDRICRSPYQYPVLRQDVRRCLVHGFPYGVMYRIVAETIHIIAVAHLHREPGYWRKRDV